MAYNNTLDVTQEIKLDHDNVRDLFERYKSASDKDERGMIANTLIREMAIHGDAEEISVYNEFEKLGLGDTAVHNKEEHATIKKLVYEADTTSTDKPEYDSILKRAVSTFLEHAGEEEQSQLPMIKDKVSPEDNDAMARSFLAARKKVPTRPHPSAPQTGGMAQKAMGAKASMMDTLLETMQGRKFVDLKHQHPDVNMMTEGTKTSNPAREGAP